MHGPRTEGKQGHTHPQEKNKNRRSNGHKGYRLVRWFCKQKALFPSLGAQRGFGARVAGRRLGGGWSGVG
jgi:hypothetical protein